DGGKALHNFSCLGIEDQKASWKTGNDEQPMVCLIQRHRIIRQRAADSPSSDNSMLFSIEDSDLERFRQIYVDAWFILLKLERFWMGIKLCLSDLRTRGIKLPQPATTIANIDVLRVGVVAEVVGVVSKFDGLQRF